MVWRARKEMNGKNRRSEAGNLIKFCLLYFRRHRAPAHTNISILQANTFGKLRVCGTQASNHQVENELIHICVLGSIPCFLYPARTHAHAHARAHM